MIGIIIKAISDDYTVKLDKNYIICKARGNFRHNNITPLVGDKVVIDLEKKIIIEVLTRKNSLIRPPVSNIDQAIIVVSCIEPMFSTNLLDKLLIIILKNRIKPIICLTKIDLLSFSEKRNLKKTIKYYQKQGFTIVTNKTISKIKKIVKKKVTILTGQSGVGKSTLLNKIDNKLNLKTDNISLSLKRGKHTTRHVELYEVNNGFIADTPGFSSLDFIDITKEDIRNNMIEFDKYKDKCQYRNCFHFKEDNCQIKKMVSQGKIMTSRYDNYLKFIKDKEGNNG